MLRRIRRKMFGKNLPHYLKDGIGLIKYINFFRLIPTLYILVSAPGHFFKSIPAIIKGKKTYYVSPLQFLLNMAVLQIAFVNLFPSDSDTSAGKPVNQLALMAMNFGLAVLSPVIMAIACAVILILWYGGRSRWPLNKFIPSDALNCAAIQIPLSPSTYRALDWERFLWSLPYYYLYFYLTLLVVSGVFAVCTALAVLSNVDLNINGNLLGLLIGVLALIVSCCGYWVLVRPYIFLLTYSARRLTPLMMMAGLHADNRPMVVFANEGPDRRLEVCPYCGGRRRHTFFCPAK